MFSKGDRYKKLHRRRRRESRSLVPLIVVVLLFGGALTAANYMLANEDTRSLSLSLATAPAPSDDAVVAVLTARDAVRAALLLSAEPAAAAREKVAGKKSVPPVDPTRWSPGHAVQLKGALRKNESLSIALGKRGVSQGQIAALVAGMKGEFDFRDCRPGDAWEADVNAAGELTRFRYQSSPTEIIEVRKKGGGFETNAVAVPVESKQEAVKGAIESSLWQSFEKTTAGGKLAAQYSGVFAYTIDFATESQPGDRFGAVYESTWLDGQKLRSGRLLAAHYSGEAGEHWAFWWPDAEEGAGAYYTGDGESVERQFLRSPLATVRITSRYGRRFHPVLGREKMHAGVDYGAPTGTPVQAVADGRVTWAGWKGANGNLVAIQHAGGYTTYYAHLSAITSGLRPGSRVRKKQIIGKVGNTGRSTGPHLHFGMKRHGTYINPLKVDFERGAPLSGADKRRFLAAVAPLKAKLAM